MRYIFLCLLLLLSGCYYPYMATPMAEDMPTPAMLLDISRTIMVRMVRLVRIVVRHRLTAVRSLIPAVSSLIPVVSSNSRTKARRSFNKASPDLPTRRIAARRMT